MEKQQSTTSLTDEVKAILVRHILPTVRRARDTGMTLEGTEIVNHVYLLHCVSRDY